MGSCRALGGASLVILLVSCGSRSGNPADVGSNADAGSPAKDGGERTELPKCAAGECSPSCAEAAASRGSSGCEFRVASAGADVSAASLLPPPCLAVFVSNNGNAPAMLSVSFAGQSHDVSKFGRIALAEQPAESWPPLPSTGLPPGQAATLYLSDEAGALGCPVTPAIRTKSGTTIPGTGRGNAWSVRANVPITAYSVAPIQGSPSLLPAAELLVPVASWGNNYLAVLPPKGKGVGNPLWVQLIAAEDDTHVEILPNTNLPGTATVAAATASLPATYTLQAGEVLQWHGVGGLTGSVVAADKNIAYLGGMGAPLIAGPNAGSGAATSNSMAPPVSALASEYAVAPFLTSDGEVVSYRLVGSAANTELIFEPPVANAPKTLGLGQVADFRTNAPFVVRSQGPSHPFYLGQVRGECPEQSNVTCITTEDLVHVRAAQHLATRYAFHTDAALDATLVVTRQKSDRVGFQPVEISCLESPSVDWRAIGASNYEYAHVTIAKGTREGDCRSGAHVAKSVAPFGVDVWVAAHFGSYGYSAGASRTPLNAVVVPVR